jgi:hypothetical protein
MGNDWPRIGKIIISAVPAIMILLGVVLVLIDWPWRVTIMRLGTWMVILGALLFVFELVLIYYSSR